MTRTLFLALAFGLALAAPTSADDGKDNLKRYCTGDATTSCGGMDPGGEEIKACLTKHRKDLSDASERTRLDCRRAHHQTERGERHEAG